MDDSPRTSLSRTEAPGGRSAVAASGSAMPQRPPGRHAGGSRAPEAGVDGAAVDGAAVDGAAVDGAGRDGGGGDTDTGDGGGDLGTADMAVQPVAGATRDDPAAGEDVGSRERVPRREDADLTTPSGLRDGGPVGPAGPARPPGAAPTAAHPATDLEEASTPSTAIVLGGRYLLEERIASGGMAAVWRAHDEVLARTVAVKVLHGHLAADGAFRERFRREAVSAAKLTHPGIVSIYDTGTDGDTVYLVMEFVDGVTLKDVIADNGALAPADAATIGQKVALGLAYAHERGLVHRDVKPANILIGHDGSVKVADFGIAKVEEGAQDLTRTGMVLGTAAYVAPEQITGQPVDGRADQYGLGCVLYEALAGQQPFKGDSAVATAAQRLEHDAPPLRRVRADVPRSLSDVLDRALARDPDERFPSCAAFADALAGHADADTDRTAALLTPADAGARRAAAPPPGEPAGQSFLRSEGRWLAPVLALIVLAGALVGAGLATGVLEGGEGMPFTFARGSEEPGPEPGEAEPTAVPLSPVDLDDFDPPPGDNREKPEDLPAMLDGDPDTAWQTEGYESPELVRLKDGVGFTVDLGGTVRVQEVTLVTTTPGISYELRVPSAEGPSTDIDDWRVVATVADAPTTAVTELPGTEADVLLVWVTGDLQPADPPFYRAGFSELAVEGVPVEGR